MAHNEKNTSTSKRRWLVLLGIAAVTAVVYFSIGNRDARPKPDSTEDNKPYSLQTVREHFRCGRWESHSVSLSFSLDDEQIREKVGVGAEAKLSIGNISLLEYRTNSNCERDFLLVPISVNLPAPCRNAARS
jgi:hypothetical protein